MQMLSSKLETMYLNLKIPFFNFEITDEEIVNSIKNLKESKAAGPDGIPPGIFIHSNNAILPIIT